MRRAFGIIMTVMMCLLVGMLAVVPLAFAADNGGSLISFEDILGKMVAAAVSIVGVLVARLVAWGIKKIKSSTAQAMAWQAVMWAEQRFKAASGTERYQQAKARLAKKIKYLDEDDIDELIESAVGEMNRLAPKVQGSSAV